MAKFIREVFKNDTFSLSECNDGYYLYDHVLRVNVAMRAKTEQDAFIESLFYYKKRLEQVKREYAILNEKVESFLIQFKEDEDSHGFSNSYYR